jgi:hypothetical protein
MARKGLITAICISAVAIPAVALGGPPPDPEYGGKIEGNKNHYLGFDVKGSGGDRKIKNGFITNIRFKCNNPDNNDTQGGTLEKPIPVKADGSFDKTVNYDFGPPMPPRGGAEGIRYRMKGELKGDKASGFIDIELLKSGGCHTGKQDFEVKKPAPPVPPS